MNSLGLGRGSRLERGSWGGGLQHSSPTEAHRVAQGVEVLCCGYSSPDTGMALGNVDSFLLSREVPTIAVELQAECTALLGAAYV